jgi:hypothetical protein
MHRPEGIRPRHVVRAAIAHTTGTSLARYLDKGAVRCTECGTATRRGAGFVFCIACLGLGHDRCARPRRRGRWLCRGCRS